MRALAAPPAQGTRTSLTGKRGPKANLARLRLIREAIKGGTLPALLVPIARLMSSSRLLSWVLPVLPAVPVRLEVRRSGAIVRTPILDAWVTFEVFAFHEYQFDDIPWRSIRTVIDCGAHVGAFAMWVSEQSPCAIAAIEPSPSTFSFLAKNLAPLHDRVQCFELALAGQSGSRAMYDQGFAASSSFVRRTPGSRTYKVEGIRFDDLLGRTGFKTVDLLKMDIEGAEQEVFESISTTTLQRIGSAIIECHPFAGTDTAFLKRRLTEAGMVVREEPYLLIATRSPGR